MHRSLMATAAVLLSCVIGGANEKPPVVQDLIHATPAKIKVMDRQWRAKTWYRLVSSCKAWAKVRLSC